MNKRELKNMISTLIEEQRRTLVEESYSNNAIDNTKDLIDEIKDTIENIQDNTDVMSDSEFKELNKLSTDTFGLSLEGITDEDQFEDEIEFYLDDVNYTAWIESTKWPVELDGDTFTEDDKINVKAKLERVGQTLKDSTDDIIEYNKSKSSKDLELIKMLNGFVTQLQKISN